MCVTTIAFASTTTQHPASAPARPKPHGYLSQSQPQRLPQPPPNPASLDANTPFERAFVGASARHIMCGAHASTVYSIWSFSWGGTPAVPYLWQLFTAARPAQPIDACSRAGNVRPLSCFAMHPPLCVCAHAGRGRRGGGWGGRGAPTKHFSHLLMQMNAC